MLHVLAGQGRSSPPPRAPERRWPSCAHCSRRAAQRQRRPPRPRPIRLRRRPRPRPMPRQGAGATQPSQPPSSGTSSPSTPYTPPPSAALGAASGSAAGAATAPEADTAGADARAKAHRAKARRAAARRARARRAAAQPQGAPARGRPPSGGRAGTRSLPNRPHRDRPAQRARPELIEQRRPLRRAPPRSLRTPRTPLRKRLIRLSRVTLVARSVAMKRLLLALIVLVHSLPERGTRRSTAARLRLRSRRPARLHRLVPVHGRAQVGLAQRRLPTAGRAGDWQQSHDLHQGHQGYERALRGDGPASGDTTGRDGDASTSTALAPTVTGPGLGRPPDSGEWFNHPVAFGFTGQDATSGIESCTGGTYSGPDGAGVSVEGSCRDVAGNVTARSLHPQLRRDAATQAGGQRAAR